MQITVKRQLAQKSICVQHSALYSLNVNADMVRDSCIYDNNALMAA